MTLPLETRLSRGKLRRVKVRAYSSILRFLADTCLSFPCPNHTRCNHCSRPPVLFKTTHRHPQPRPACIQLIQFYTLPRTPRKIFFFLYFAPWRAAYYAGLGYVLKKQSRLFFRRVQLFHIHFVFRIH